jgi:glycerophosphoryl diester phosphodiesterase
MTNQVVVQCVEYEPLMEIRRLAPEIPVGYLMSVNAIYPARLKVDFLSAELGRVTGAFVRAAQRRGQAVHVWTVDAPTDMARMIAVGVDALITNEPAKLCGACASIRASAGPNGCSTGCMPGWRGK